MPFQSPSKVSGEQASLGPSHTAACAQAAAGTPNTINPISRHSATAQALEHERRRRKRNGGRRKSGRDLATAHPGAVWAVKSRCRRRKRGCARCMLSDALCCVSKPNAAISGVTASGSPELTGEAYLSYQGYVKFLLHFVGDQSNRNSACLIAPVDRRCVISCVIVDIDFTVGCTRIAGPDNKCNSL
jgi:hypothetical protein